MHCIHIVSISRTLIGRGLPHCRGAAGVFYSPNWLGNLDGEFDITEERDIAKNFNIIFFHHTTCESPCDTLSHQPPTRGDNTVSVAHGGTAIPGATKQLLPPDKVLRELYIYIYMTDQLRAETTLDVNLYF